MRNAGAHAQTRVELPHVAEVAEVGQPRRRSRHTSSTTPGWKPWSGATSGPTTIQRCSTAATSARPAETTSAVRHAEPRRPGDQLREDAAEGERADHDAHRETAPVGEPADDQLHADRVDQRQRHAGHHPQQHRTAPARRPAVAVASVASAATAAPIPISRGGCTRSGRLVTAETSAPVTKPSWTPIVSSASPDPPDLPLRHAARARPPTPRTTSPPPAPAPPTPAPAGVRRAGPSGAARRGTTGPALTGAGARAAPAGSRARARARRGW